MRCNWLLGLLFIIGCGGPLWEGCYQRFPADMLLSPEARELGPPPDLRPAFVFDDNKEPTALWLKTCGPNSVQDSPSESDVAFDPSGNVLAAFKFKDLPGPFDCGGGALGFAGTGVVLVKYSPMGQLLDQKALMGSVRHVALGVDSKGNVVLAGYADDAIVFNGMERTGSPGAFIALYVNNSLNGRLTFKNHRFLKNGSNLPIAVTVDKNAQIIMGGSCSGMVDFGDGLQRCKLFLSRLEIMGEALITRDLKMFDNNVEEYMVTEIVTNLDGDVFWTGRIRDGNPPNFQFVLFKHNMKFDLIQSTTLGFSREMSSSDLSPGGVAINRDNEIFVTGQEQGKGLIAKYKNVSGGIMSNWNWTKFEGPSMATDVAIDATGNAVISGWFEKDVEFSGRNILSAGQSSSNALVLKLLKFTSNLDARWGKSYGSDAVNDLAWRVATDPYRGRVALIGIAQSSPLDLDAQRRQHGGVFIALLGSPPDAAPPDAAPPDFNDSVKANAQWVKLCPGLTQQLNGLTYPESDVAFDSDGNVIVSVKFTNPTGPVDCGGGVIGEAGTTVVAVAKYSPAGMLLDQKRITGKVLYTALAADGVGNVVLAGYANGTYTVKDTGGVDQMGTEGTFVVRYESKSTTLTFKNHSGFTPGGFNKPIAVATDADNKFVLAGTCQGVMNFEGSSIGKTCTNAGFLARLSTTGGFFTLNKFEPLDGSCPECAFSGLAVHSDGSVFLTGHVNGNPGWLSTGAGDGYQIFLSKHDANTLLPVANGKAMIATSSMPTNLFSGGVAISKDDVFVSGANKHRAVLARYVNVLVGGITNSWRLDHFSSATSYATGVAVDSSGNAVFIGSFVSNMIGIGPDTLTGGANYEAFLAKFAPDQTPKWAKSIGDTSSGAGDLIDIGLRVATDPSRGRIAILGTTANSSLKIDTKSASGGAGWFFALLAP